MRMCRGVMVAWLGLVSVGAIAGEPPGNPARFCVAPSPDAGLPLVRCGGDTAARVDRVIAGCSALLAAAATPPEQEPAQLYYKRGLAHVQRLFCGGGATAFDDAIKDLDEAIRQAPAYRDAYAARALAYEYKGDHMKAVGDFRQAYRIGIPPRWLVERLEIIENAP